MQNDSSSVLRWRAKRNGLTDDTPRDRGYIEDYGDNDDTSKASKQIFSWTALRAWCTTTMLATAAIASCILSIHFVDIVIVKIACGSTIISSFIIMLQQRKLRKLVTLRHQHNEVRKRLNYFRQERERLHRTMDRLDEIAADLHHIPKELHEISKTQDVDMLLGLIEEQKSVQEEMRKYINQKVMQNIMSIIFRTDRDGNWTLRPTEVEALVVKLGYMEEIEFNENRFREIIGNEPDLGKIMEIIRSLLEKDDEYQYADPIFKVKIVRGQS